MWEYILEIGAAYLLAGLVHVIASTIARWMSRAASVDPRERRPGPERRATLASLIASIISFSSFIAATLFALGQFVQLDTLVWVAGFMSAGFGFGARALISDVLTGISLLFEDPFAVGEKVEILDVEGVVERVTLRTTSIRAPTGELYVVPNGEVRVVRNFSRGRFSMANVRVKVAAADLSKALPLLQEISEEAVSLLPNLLEPWKVISETGTIGQQAELTLVARARFGKAAEMRPRLLTLVQERLAEADIAMSD
jgi:small conductance mechanosensitive channel